ncbi:MAG: hypothetical protein WA921_14235 [Ahrensia sp.]
MNEFIYALLVLGCSHNLDVCREATAQPMIFETSQACEASVQTAYLSVDDFPMAVAQCIPLEASSFNVNSETEWFFAADGSLQLQVLPETTEVATLDVNETLATSSFGARDYE